MVYRGVIVVGREGSSSGEREVVVVLRGVVVVDRGGSSGG